MNGNDRKERSLVAAQKLIERGQLDKALVELRKIVEEDLTDTRTWLRMADLQSKLGAAEEAADIYVRMGELYVSQGFAQKAVAVYKNAVKLVPGLSRAHLRLGALYRQLGQVSEAVSQLELAAAALQRAGSPADAAGALRQAVAADPDNAVLRVKLAEAASLAGLVDEAVREFGRAAESLKAQGRIDESLRVMERLLFHQPENTTRARELAEAYIAKGSPRLALPKLQACLNASPREPRTLTLLARALEQLGQTEKAVSVLKELARVCHELGRSADRDAAIAHAMTLAPTDAETQALGVRHGVRGAPGTGGDPTPPPAKNRSRVSADGPGSAAPVRGSAPGPSPGPALGHAAGHSGGGSFDLSGSVRGGASTTSSAAPVAVGDLSDRVVLSGATATDAADVARILAESDVFVKYGLLERAVDHFGRVFDLDPGNREARERVAAVLQKLGRKAEAARHLEILAEQLSQTQPAEARRRADQAAAPEPPATRGRPAAPPVAPGRAAPDARARGLAPLPPAALQTDDDPNADVATPPPEVSGLQDEATPAPSVLAEAPDEDGSDFEQEVSTGDVVVVREDPGALRARVSASEETDHDLERDDEVTPAPAARGGPATPRVVALTRKPGDAGAARDLPRPAHDEDAAGAFEGGAATFASSWAPEPSRGGAPVDDELGEELEQVAFFLSQSLPDDARSLLADLDRRFPRDARVVSKLREIEAYEARVAAAEASLAARRASAGAAPGGGGRRANTSTADATPSPRAFVEAGGVADASTHFDLAIAYKEMGLLDAAIVELKVVADDPEREVMALTTMGECYEAKGSFTDAVIRYKEALNCTPITQAETMQLYFLLGGAFDRLGDASEALYFFEKVARRDPKFRDVGQRIALLKPKLMKTASP